MGNNGAQILSKHNCRVGVLFSWVLNQSIREANNEDSRDALESELEAKNY